MLTCFFDAHGRSPRFRVATACPIIFDVLAWGGLVIVMRDDQLHLLGPLQQEAASHASEGIRRQATEQVLAGSNGRDLSLGRGQDCDRRLKSPFRSSWFPIDRVTRFPSTNPRIAFAAALLRTWHRPCGLAWLANSWLVRGLISLSLDLVGPFGHTTWLQARDVTVISSMRTSGHTPCQLSLGLLIELICFQ
jgi:hypothetical protein